MMRRDKKDEEMGENPFRNLDKTTALQEAKVFHETPINSRRCSFILTKILYVINQGEPIGATEATDAFFAITKLFQCKDPHLRKMVYLCIKALGDVAEHVIIVTSSLTRDMTGKDDQFRGPAIRALCQITDATMLQSIERYMKQAIVDRTPSVASSALISSMLMMQRGGADVVRRWVNEAQEAVNSENVMVQYHGIGLLYQIRKNDKLAIRKLVSKYTSSNRQYYLRSPYAICFMLRIVAKLLDEEDSIEHNLFDYLETCLRHKSEMVTFEAAQAIVGLRHTSAKELANAVSVLQLFCSNPKPTLRYAAVRTLNKVSMKHPSAVAACNMDLENLISDSNRSIATLAITTLLKTAQGDTSVERLMKQVTNFMSEISDEFKVVVVQAVRSLCQRFPRKHLPLMGILSTILREEGGFAYKKEIVDTIIAVVDENSEAKDAGLSHLCEFIEDCEHTVLATRILNLLGREGPKSSSPSKYIRFIYNRIILENAAVRAAAVTALAKFGAHCESLLPSIRVLLRRSLLDDDDEVRDRATFYLSILEKNDRALNATYITNSLQVSVVGLERALVTYTTSPDQQLTPFNLKSVPLEVAAPQRMPDAGGMAAAGAAKRGPEAAAAAVKSQQDLYYEQLEHDIPDLQHLGGLFKSSSLPVELTESETEYVVRCIKHTFNRHILLQFDCINTLNDQLLTDVTMELEPRDDCVIRVVKAYPAAELRYNQPNRVYCLLALPDDPSLALGSFGCLMKFVVKDCDPQTGEPDEEEGYADEYSLEDVSIDLEDHIQKTLKANFSSAWDELSEENELQDTYELSHLNSIKEAVKSVLDVLRMQPCERSERVAEGKKQHMLLLSGVMRGGHDVLVKIRMVEVNGVTLQVTVRSSDPTSGALIHACLG